MKTELSGYNFKRYFLTVSALLLFSCLWAQEKESELASSDSVFFMKLYRETNKVKVMLYFNTPSLIQNINVERSQLNGNYFSRCKFFDLSNEALTDTIILTDNYPLPASVDILYRLRIINKEGITRVYPPVKLAAVKMNN